MKEEERNKTNETEKEKEQEGVMLSEVLSSLLSSQGVLMNSMATLFLVEKEKLKELEFEYGDNGDKGRFSELSEILDKGLTAQVMSLQNIEDTMLKLYGFKNMDEAKEAVKKARQRYEAPTVKVVSGREAMEELAKILGF